MNASSHRTPVDEYRLERATLAELGNGGRNYSLGRDTAVSLASQDQLYGDLIELIYD